MLARYKIPFKKKLPPEDPASHGTRIDTRKHTRSCLRPTTAMVERFLADPGAESWEELRREYTALLARRFAADRSEFDRLADLARREDVFLGCSCPTKNVPDVNHCHTVMALRFMQEKYSDLEVEFP
jgi:hypothetical protein